MEKQNVVDGATVSNNFTVRELYDIKERNYDWQSFKYELPRKYTHSPTSNLRSGSLFCTKKNYLDDLEKDKKKIPGPNHYNYSTNCLRPKSGKMDKGERKTMSEQVKESSQKQNIPGPGAYFKRPQSATSTYKREGVPIAKKHYLNQVEYLASIYPGVGNYNLSTPQHVTSPKMSKQVHKKTQKKDKQNNQKLLNPTRQIEGTFEWMKNQQKKKDCKFFTRSQRFKTESKQSKKIGPTTYKLNNDWLSKTNLASMTYSSSHKSVYYH